MIFHVESYKNVINRFHCIIVASTLHCINYDVLLAPHSTAPNSHRKGKRTWREGKGKREGKGHGERERARERERERTLDDFPVSRYMKHLSLNVSKRELAEMSRASKSARKCITPKINGQAKRCKWKPHSGVWRVWQQTRHSLISFTNWMWKFSLN